MLSDAAAVERLVEHRKSVANVVTRRFDDSNHCRMHVDHPQEYGAIIDEALEQVAAVVQTQGVGWSEAADHDRGSQD